MTAMQARELMQRLRAERDCEQAAYSLSAHSEAQMERGTWRWLSPEMAAAERAARRVAAARLGQGCAPVSDSNSARQMRYKERDRLEALASRGGDLGARLYAASRGTRLSDAAKADLRGLLYEALLSGDPELIAQLGDSVRAVDSRGWVYERQVWQLVACDLGRDCGSSSRALDRMCLFTTSGACGQESLEAALRYTIAEPVFDRMQQRRAELLARIRSGQVAGLFDPAPVPPPGP